MKGRKKWIIPASAVGAALTGWIWWGNTALMVSRLTVASQRLTEAFSGIRIAHISDLHNTEFGPDNKRLLWLLEECAPDLIVITGDLVDSRRTDLVSARVFAEGAAGQFWKMGTLCCAGAGRRLRCAGWQIPASMWM